MDNLIQVRATAISAVSSMYQNTHFSVMYPPTFDNVNALANLYANYILHGSLLTTSEQEVESTEPETKLVEAKKKAKG